VLKNILTEEVFMLDESGNYKSNIFFVRTNIHRLNTSHTTEKSALKYIKKIKFLYKKVLVKLLKNGKEVC
jgi:hypothetical protein